ncbi:PREDICTED: group XV phospholipase A2-like isoform X1 [Amphimedon queenslandica]|uniref:Uncharacterized protein n=1 Tax=Amphimedon queenslandica TaxID=400682 RepID=A0AAN0K507_AMPQE|nr:PREDICTED: group XV phospholipase A2-like isoform X1 [Amphimedon queenslandica]|eukprot:XP_019864310.1 PREDICTED: group XV phospholipase A2-like isoform X1 [Amphimedon queenslandica]
MELSFLLILLTFLPVSQLARSPIVIGMCIRMVTLKCLIFLVPGLLGSKFEAKLNKPDSKAPCMKTSDWYTLWVNITTIFPDHDKCLVDNLKLMYDEDNWYYNTEGIEIRVPGFGETDTIEELGVDVPYFHNFVEHFVKLGYTRGKDINGAPFDWRLAPDGLKRIRYYEALHQLIEDSYNRNGQTPVTLVAHSLGGPVSLYFLSKYVSSDWKASRIKQFVSLSGVFGGTLKIILELISGDEQNIIRARPLVLREALRSFPSSVFLLPSPALWGEDEAIVVQPKRNYTSRDYEELFTDISYTNGSRIYNEVKDLISDFPPPNVTHYCYYGSDVHTHANLYYNSSFPDSQPVHIMPDNGDGTVNERSLQSCRLWRDKQVFPVIEKSFVGVSHRNMVLNKEVLAAIEKLVLS